MIDHTFFCEGESSGLVIYDAAYRPKSEKLFLEHLNVVLDQEGETDVATGPLSQWFGTYNRALRGLRTFGKGQFALVICGDYFPYRVSVRDNGLTPFEQILLKETFEDFVRVPSGKLVVADAMDLFTGGFDGAAGTAQISVPEGDYRIDISHLRLPPSPTNEVGLFHQATTPTVVLSLQQSQNARGRGTGSSPYAVLTDHQEEAFRFEPGKKCHARVRRIEDETVTLSLLLTEECEHGFGRMQPPDGENLATGQVILVELVEDRRNFWFVRFVSAS